MIEFFLQGLEKNSISDLNNRENKYELVLGMKELASRGMAAEVVEEVNAFDPNFFVQNPVLLFQLKQVKMYLVIDDIIYGMLRAMVSDFV